MPILKSLTNKDLEYLSRRATKRDNIILSLYFGVKTGTNYHSELNSLVSGGVQKIKQDASYGKNDKEKISEMSEKLKKAIGLLRLPKKTRAMAGFIGTDLDLRLYRLPIHIPSKFVVKADAYVRPISEAMEKFSRYAVAVIDRNQAAFYEVSLGEIEKNQEIITSDVPKKIKRANADDWKGRREPRIARHIEDHLERHLKKVSEKIAEYSAKNGIEYLLIGAHRELLPKIIKILDKKSSEKLIGSYHIPHYTDGNYIKEKSMEIISKYEKGIEEKIAENLMNGASEKKWRSVLGADSVLKNLYRRNLNEIVIAGAWKKPGYLCAACYYIMTTGGDCPQCGGKPEKIRDLADNIIEEASNNKIPVKHLFYPHKEFDRYGIGAFLKMK